MTAGAGGPEWIWDGLQRLVDLGFTERQISLILEYKAYHRAHPEEGRHITRHCGAADGTSTRQASSRRGYGR